VDGFLGHRGATVEAVAPVKSVTLLKVDPSGNGSTAAFRKPRYMPVARSYLAPARRQRPQNITTMRGIRGSAPTVEIASQVSRELAKIEANTRSRRCSRDGRVAAPHHRR
jgi:superfamily II DNA/RNA helicase